MTTAEAPPGRRPASRSAPCSSPVGDATPAPRRRCRPGPRSVPSPLDADGRLVHPLLAAAPTLSLWRAPTDNDRIGGMAARWAELGRRPARAAPGRHRSGRRDDHGRRAPSSSTADGTVIPHEAAYTCLRRRRHRRRRRPSTSARRPGRPRAASGRSSRSCPVRRTCAGSVPVRTRRTRIASAAAWSASGGRRSPTSTSRTSGRRRTAATPTCAGSSSADAGPAPACGSTSTNAAPGVGHPPARRRPRRRDPRHRRRPVAETVIHLDAAHRGLGTASCGPDTLPEYRLATGRHRWAWTLRDLPAELTVPIAGRRTAASSTSATT